MTRTLLTAAFATLIAADAYALAPVPEIGGAGGLTALAVVGAVVALVWERRRRK